MSEERRNPGQAAVLSFVFSGLGEIYNGQILKGLLIMFFTIISTLVLLVGSLFIALWILGKVAYFGALILGVILFLIGLFFICIFGIYSIFDSYRFPAKK